MLIVVDGLDRTGKTRLAHRLAGATGGAPAWQIHHRGPPTHSPWTDYCGSLRKYVPGEDDAVVDRSFVSEYVWPRVFGRESTLTEEGLNSLVQIAGWHRMRGAVHVHAARDERTLAAELAEHPEPLRPEDVGRADALYWKAYTLAGITPVVWRDFGSPDPERNFDQIVGMARDCEARAVRDFPGCW